MPSDPRKRVQSTPAEISLVNLNNCFVNLPVSLCSLLANLNTLAQNVIVEISYRVVSSNVNLSNGVPNSKSIYLGWTGMQSKRKLAPIVTRDGISVTKGSSSGREQEVALIELDSTFARTVGISDGQKVTASLHLDPPIAHTINIEPLTPEDWEMIELHATFLELNLVAQIRALPNPNYTPENGPKGPPHPLTLKLSPTSTASIKILSLIPDPPFTSPFAKLAPDAEVIVAPKTRSKPSRSHGESRSVTSRRSASGRSGTSSVRRKTAREEKMPALYLRGLDRSVCDEWFEDDKNSNDHGFVVWVDRDLLLSKMLHGVTWVSVSILKPAILQMPTDPQKQQQEGESMGEAGRPTSKVIARIVPWDDPPDSLHIALSTVLCAAMACEGMVGGIVKLQPAPPRVSKSTPGLSDPDQPSPKMNSKVVKIYPFSSAKAMEGLKFGGESRADREEAARRIMKIYNYKGTSGGLFNGPLTEGSLLPVPSGAGEWNCWEGGILRFGHAPTAESGKRACHWFLGSEHKFTIEVQPPVPHPTLVSAANLIGEPLPAEIPTLVGIDHLIDQLQSHLSHMSSVLLTGAQGSGKSSIAQFLAHQFRKGKLFHTTYFSCQKLQTEETQVSTIKETLNRVFLGASWGARLGGKSLVILDDVDKICPAETELETSENGRSRHISEGLCSIFRQYSARDRGVVLLATAQAKESLHNVIVGGHIVREIIALKAPDKEGRRQVLEMLVSQSLLERDPSEPPSASSSRPLTADGSVGEEGAWMDSSSEISRTGTPQNDGFVISTNLDFLDIAGETDGYMPGDLVLLVSRAKSEALIRTVSLDPENEDSVILKLGREDFTSALNGFTPTSLRNVTLQTSTTTWDSIGGLHATRKVLLETLQYPTTYAPIFAQCPLRLRSGLLLYGYPGCGKTLLASAVAGECGLNFISVKGPEILNKYIGASEKSVRDLFERAEAARPCVLFFDEFDSIAPKRGHDSTGVTDRVVNQLLTQMDGAEGLSGVYVLAATSRPDLIDPALLRPGRLDKSLICDLPDERDRVDILSALSRKLRLSNDVLTNLPEIASHTEGYSGADLQALVYNAHLDAIHDVLGDHENLGNNQKLNRSNGKIPTKTRDFIQFFYGEEEERLEYEARAKGGLNKSKLLVENSAVSAKLAEIKAIRRSQRQGLGARGEEKEKGEGKVERDTQEVVIQWRHLERSLKGTRASISEMERERLAAIYREFLTGRDGEVRNGEGGREIGGRVSLM